MITTHGPDFNGFPGLLYRAFLAVLFAAALLVVLQQVAQRDQLPWRLPQQHVMLGGAHYRVPVQQVAWLQEFSTLYFSGREAEARAFLEQESAQRLSAVFGNAQARLPTFADWYYSLSGEYSRLSMAVLARLNLTDRDYPAEQAAAILFPAGWEEDLAEAQRQLSVMLMQNQKQVHAQWLAELSERLSPYRVPAPLEGQPEGRALVLDDFLANELIRQEQQALQLRGSLSTVAAMGVAGRTLWRAASARSAAAAGRAAAGRGAARAGSAALGAGTVCAPAGPAALGCAALAGAATWLASDWLLLNIDAHFNRDELITAMSSGLEQLEAQTHQQVVSAYDRLISDWYADMATEISTDFVPVDAVRQSRSLPEPP